MRAVRGSLLTVVALFLAPRAAALPVDGALDLKPGDLHFEKIRFAMDAEVLPRTLATAELLPAGELLVTPLTEGDGILLLYKQGEVRAIRLHVNRAAVAAPLELQEAKRLCGGAEARVVEGETYLYATVADEPCRAALKRALEGDALFADHLRLTFTIAGLQAQLRAMAQRLNEAGIAGVGLGYAGATLSLKGQLARATHLKALGVLWREALGHLNLDDQIELPSTSVDHDP